MHPACGLDDRVFYGSAGAPRALVGRELKDLLQAKSVTDLLFASSGLVGAQFCDVVGYKGAFRLGTTLRRLNSSFQGKKKKFE